MKYIITEEQNIRLMVVRRLYFVDGLLEITLRRPFTYDICYYGRESFLDHIITRVNEDMYYFHFSDIDDDSKEWHKIWNLLSIYITDTYSKKIFDFYKNKCGDDFKI
jgi:hypothetical protein